MYGPTCDEPIHTGSDKFCIFHDTNYLKGDNYEKHKEEVARRFEEKLSRCSSNNMPLKFISYCLPDISFQNKEFTEVLYFDYATFYGAANFSGATFSKGAYFRGAKFSYCANFSGATFYNTASFGGATFSESASFSGSTFLNKAYFAGKFNGPTFFNYTIFEEPTKVTFDIGNMSNVSFSDTDITRIKFSDKVTWGGNDGFTIIEEKWLEHKSQEISLDLVLSVYRNLRENMITQLNLPRSE